LRTSARDGKSSGGCGKSCAGDGIFAEQQSDGEGSVEGVTCCGSIDGSNGEGGQLLLDPAIRYEECAT
jgi:hypothetical protein